MAHFTIHGKLFTDDQTAWHVELSGDIAKQDDILKMIDYAEGVGLVPTIDTRSPTPSGAGTGRKMPASVAEGYAMLQDAMCPKCNRSLKKSQYPLKGTLVTFYCSNKLDDGYCNYKIGLADDGKIVERGAG